MTSLPGLENIYGGLALKDTSMRRRNHRRTMAVRNIVQSFKKVINDAPASRLSATSIQTTLSTGVDSVAAGQTGPTDSNVPTGSVIKFFEIQWSMGNVSGGNNFFNVAIMQVHTGQSIVAPNVVGGSALRNQVFHQDAFQIGTDQNGSRKYRFKVPPKFQRVREGDSWRFIRQGDATFSDAVQVIYKFYR